MNETGKPTEQYSEAERREEEKWLRFLRRLVDFSFAHIAQSPMPPEEAQRIVQAARRKAAELFPGKEDTFELIYTPRFRRLIAEKYRLQ